MFFYFLFERKKKSTEKFVSFKGDDQTKQKKIFVICRRRRHRNKARQSVGAEMPPPPFLPPVGSDGRAPLLSSPLSGGPRAPSGPAVETVYVGLGGARTTPLDILREKRVRVPEELQGAVQGLNVTSDQIKLAVDNHNRMQARAHLVAREMGVLAPLGEKQQQPKKKIEIWICPPWAGRGKQVWF